MRKITAVLMALALALSLFACGGEPVQDETPGSDIQQGTVKIRVRTKIMHKRLPRTQSRRRIITIITVIMLQFQAIPRFPAGNTARYGSAIWSWAVC